MVWIIYAITAAFFNASKNALMKKVSGSLDAYTVALFSNAAMLPILWGHVFLRDHEWSIEPNFWILMLLMLPFELAVTLLFFKAVKDSEISAAFPFVSFLPFFIAIGAFFILGEVPSPYLMLGLIFLSIGAFFMNKVLSGMQGFVWRGALYMFIASMIWGYLAPMGKLAISYSSEQLFPAIYFSLAVLVFTPLYLLRHTSPLSLVQQVWPWFIAIGGIYGLFIAFKWLAFSSGPTSGVAALDLLAVIFTVLFGGAYFNEKNIRKKLLATLLMLSGAAVIILFG